MTNTIESKVQVLAKLKADKIRKELAPLVNDVEAWKQSGNPAYQDSIQRIQKKIEWLTSLLNILED
jgi:hypothetical protein